jgi:hypothetical protein
MKTLSHTKAWMNFVFCLAAICSFERVFVALKSSGIEEIVAF